MIMQPTIGNQRPMQIQYPQSLYRLPTQQPPALSHHHLQFPPHQAIYGATPPYAPPVTTQTIRQPTPNRNSRGYNTKKTTKAIAIIDPDTNEALDTSFIKSNTSEVQSSVVSSSQSSEAKKKEFIDEVHKIANTKPPSTADTSQHRPNAIISDIQLKNTETVSKISVIDSSAKSNEMKHVVEITSDVSNQSGFLTKVTEVQPSIQIGSLSSNCTGTQDMELEGRYEQLQLETLSVQPEIKQQTHMESKVQPDDEHVILLPSQDGCSLKPDNNSKWLKEYFATVLLPILFQLITSLVNLALVLVLKRQTVIYMKYVLVIWTLQQEKLYRFVCDYMCNCFNIIGATSAAIAYEI